MCIRDRVVHTLPRLLCPIGLPDVYKRQAMFPVLKNTYTGILGVEGKYIEAAKGCGMSSFQALVKVELPLAMPTIIGGLRLSTVYTVSWAVLAAMIGEGGLGDLSLIHI